MNTKSVHDARYRSAIEALRQARRSSKMTQIELASAIGRSQQFVSKFESFERRLDAIEFMDIADALNVDWVAILGASRQVGTG